MSDSAPPADASRVPALWLARGPDAGARASAWTRRLQAQGFGTVERLSADSPAEGPPRAACLRGDLAGVELAHHWLFSRTLLGRGDALVLVETGEQDAARGLAELLAHPGVQALPEEGHTRGDLPPPLEAVLSEAEIEALAARQDPAALCRAAERSADEGWVLRPGTLLDLRARRLADARLPPEHPAWGEGAWLGWRLPDAERAAADLEDLLKRADRHGWPSAPKLRLALGICRILSAEPALTAGLLERAARELDALGEADAVLFARLGLVIARDRQGLDSRALLTETAERVSPDTAAWVRARVYDSLGAFHHRAGRIDDAIACFQQAAELARSARITRLALILEARALDVRVTSGRATPSLDELRDLRRQVAERGSLRTATAVLQLYADTARRLGAFEEAHEACTTLRRLQPAGPPPIGFAQLALERGDYEAAARLLYLAAGSREPTGRRATQLLAALSLPMHEARGDIARWEASLCAWPIGVRGGQIDVARAADTAAKLARERGDDEALVRAARASGQALLHWEALGREDRAAQTIAAAVAGHRRGAPVPLGPLDLLEPVARGTTCIVWRARHRELDLEVAVKVLTAAENNPEARASLDAEVRATARLRNPHVIGVCDLGEVDRLASALAGPTLPEGSPWVALEWAGGGTLAERRGTLSWAACRAVLDQLLDALGHAHAAGLLHRDIKPGNLMWAGEDQGLPVVKLVDFGLAGIGSQTIAGTPAYMAPEQFRAEGLGPGSDLYAVGCLAVTLIQGRPPFVGSSVMELRQAHCRAPIPTIQPLIDVPEALETWLEGLLAKDPAARFPSAGAARAALRALGPPRWCRLAPVVTAPLEDNDTLLMDRLDEVPGGPAPTLERARLTLAPVPDLPLHPEPPAPRPLGRALAGMGTPPLVGRSELQGALWRALRDAGEGRAVAVSLLALPRVGSTQVLDWLLREARAAGCAVVVDARLGLRSLSALEHARALGELALVVAEEPDPEESALLQAALAAGGALLVVVTTANPQTQATWRSAGARCAEVTRLPLHALVVLARDLAPLRGDVALRLAQAADGSPDLLSALVLARLAADELVPSPHGLLARPGVKLGALPPDCASALIAGLAEEDRRALGVVALLGEAATPARCEAAWRALGITLSGRTLDRLEEHAGRLRTRQPGLAAAALGTAPAPALLAACAQALEGAADPGAVALSASLLVSLGRVGEAIDILSALVWAFPADIGELALVELVHGCTEALAASGASARDARWGRLALVEARAALLGLRAEDADEALARVEALDPPEARTHLPLLRAVQRLSADPDGAIAGLDAALERPEIAQDPVLRIRYALLRASFAGDLAALESCLAEAEARGQHRLAGDAARALARRLAVSAPAEQVEARISQAIEAYVRAGSAHGVATALDERADLRLALHNLEGFLADTERATSSAKAGSHTALAWLNLAAARLLAGRDQEASELVAAALALGVDRARGGRRLAGLVSAALAADGPGRSWLGAVALVESDPAPLPGPVPPLLRALAHTRAARAGMGERMRWLDGQRLDSPQAPTG